MILERIKRPVGKGSERKAGKPAALADSPASNLYYHFCHVTMCHDLSVTLLCFTQKDQ